MSASRSSKPSVSSCSALGSRRISRAKSKVSASITAERSPNLTHSRSHAWSGGITGAMVVLLKFRPRAANLERLNCGRGVTQFRKKTPGMRISGHVLSPRAERDISDPWPVVIERLRQRFVIRRQDKPRCQEQSSRPWDFLEGAPARGCAILSNRYHLLDRKTWRWPPRLSPQPSSRFRRASPSSANFRSSSDREVNRFIIHVAGSPSLDVSALSRSSNKSPLA